MISTWLTIKGDFRLKDLRFFQSAAFLIGISQGTRFSFMIFWISVPVFSKKSRWAWTAASPKKQLSGKWSQKPEGVWSTGWPFIAAMTRSFSVIKHATPFSFNWPKFGKWTLSFHEKMHCIKELYYIRRHFAIRLLFSSRYISAQKCYSDTKNSKRVCDKKLFCVHTITAICKGGILLCLNVKQTSLSAVLSNSVCITVETKTTVLLTAFRLAHTRRIRP